MLYDRPQSECTYPRAGDKGLLTEAIRNDSYLTSTTPGVKASCNIKTLKETLPPISESVTGLLQKTVNELAGPVPGAEEMTGLLSFWIQAVFFAGDAGPMAEML